MLQRVTVCFLVFFVLPIELLETATRIDQRLPSSSFNDHHAWNPFCLFCLQHLLLVFQAQCRGSKKGDRHSKVGNSSISENYSLPRQA